MLSTRFLRCSGLGVLALCLIAGQACAQCSEHWIAGPATDRWITSLAVWTPPGSEQALLVAGSFARREGNVVESRVLVWDGIELGELGDAFNGHVFAVYSFNGVLFAGGSFDHVGGRLTGAVARWDGTAWQPAWPENLGSVHCLSEWNGQLVAGGSFPAFGGVAALNGTLWFPFGSAGNGRILALCADNSGGLVNGGDYEYASGMPAYGLSRWPGDYWHPAWPPGSGITVCGCSGDVNEDCSISIEDLSVLLSAFGTLHDATPEMGDVDGDGDVDLADLAQLLTHFGLGCG